jgi:Tol biopolymer transport system component
MAAGVVVVPAALGSVGVAAPSGAVGSPDDRAPAAAVRLDTSNRIAFVKGNSSPHLALMDRSGGNLVELTWCHPDGSPAFTPDGRRIVFADDDPVGQPDLWVVDTDGQNLARLTTAPERDVDPSVSPDGRLVAFTSNRGTGHGVYLMPISGESARHPATRLARGWDPAFSPDGRRLALVRRDVDGSTSIWTMDLQGRDRVRLTRGPGGWQAGPSYSPDGTKIAYSSDGAIWLMRSDGTRQRPITDPKFDGDARPAFSPNGRQVVFQRWNYARYFNIVRKPARRASHTTVLTKYPGAWAEEDVQPAWWGPALLTEPLG